MLHNYLIANNINNKINDKSRFILGDGFRITVVSPRILRIEVSKYNNFVDLSSTAFLNRYLCDCRFSISEDKNTMIITTSCAEFIFSKKTKAFTVVKIDNKIVYLRKDYENLKGTVRTLDGRFGPVKLKDGLISKRGVTVIDDSKTPLFSEDGMLIARNNDSSDQYIFAYGNRYRECIADFLKLSGQVPLVPRYALGVWWSRYYAYKQDEYIQLIEKFEKNNIPITVATVDMDWHWVDLSRFGYKRKVQILPEGWTGYSWNTDLFYDYKNFLKTLHDHNLKITLNLHPKDGVRSYENMYKDMAKEVGLDPNTKEPIPFKVSDSKYWNAYFDILHHPYEKDGVDFWWIDWQQGKEMETKGLDPLWTLNHYHYLDNNRKDTRPLILSRYAGLGSHRYPLGFSGDTAQNWKILKFMPYFTATAANVAFTWWSHDIGGHHFGKRDDELYLRWVQFGVFSPILRLHSTSSILMGKEPWRYSAAVREYATEFLRLRHKLIPYLYSLNYLNHKESRAILEPLYYSNPDNELSYKYKNEYYFGENVIVAPVCSKMEKTVNYSTTKVYLPKGRWINIFNKEIYKGNEEYLMLSEINDIPCMLKDGGIIPMSLDAGNSVDNPKTVKLLIHSGNGKFSMFEDNSQKVESLKSSITLFEVKKDLEKITIVINPASGDKEAFTYNRKYVIECIDLESYKEYSVKVNGEIISSIKENNIISIDGINPTDLVEVEILNYEEIKPIEYKEKILKIFERYQANNFIKNLKISKLKNILDDKTKCRKKIKKMLLPIKLKRILLSIK